MAAAIFAGTFAAEAQELRDRDRTLAASRKIADDLRRARIHYGPFYLLSSIQLADIGYDQDFYVPVVNTSSGFRWGLSAPQRLYLTPNRKVYFSVDFTPELSRFGGLHAHNQTGYRARADAQFLLNHLYLDAYGLKESSLRADTGEISSLLTRKDTEAGVTGEFKYSSRTSLTYSAYGRREEFPFGLKDKFQPDLPVDLLDRTEHSYRTALVHHTFPLTSLLIATEYSDYSFPNAVFKNSHREYVGVGSIYESGRTASRLEVGYARLDFLRPDQHDFNGAVGNFHISHRLSDRWNVTSSLSRDLDFSVFRDNNYYIANRGSISTQFGVTQRIALDAGWTVSQDVYDVPTANSKRDLVERRRDRVSFPYIGWTYHSPNHFTGGFDVGYIKRRSNFDVDEADGIRLILHLSLNL